MAEPPLVLRRQYLSDKLLLKLIYKESDIEDLIHQITVLNFTHKYWMSKKSLLVTNYIISN